MKYLSLFIFISFFKLEVLFAQIYPSNFIFNGCDYTYYENSFTSSRTKLCGDDYKLIFEDNFDSIKIDDTKWQTFFPWGRALNSSTSGTGFTREYMKDDNAKIKDGYLHLTTKIDSDYRDVYNIPSYDSSWMPPHNNIYFKYSSGMIFSKVNFNFGKFVVKAKIPSIDGTWPAFWLYGDCAQEIDIFEFINSSNNSDSELDSRSLILTYHKQNNCGDASFGKCENPFKFMNSENLSDDFHLYSVEWDATKILWKLDDKIVREVYRYWEISKPPPFGPTIGFANPIKNCESSRILKSNAVFNSFPDENKKMSVILSTGVAFDRGVYPTELIVDYVKIYEPINNFVIDSVKTESINLFPNPTNGIFSIYSVNSEYTINAVYVYNSHLEQIELYKGLNVGTLEIDLFDKPKGIYFIKVFSNNEIFTKRVIVK